MSYMKLIIKTPTERYPILIGSNLISNFSNILKKNSIRFNQCLFVVDKNVPKINIINLKKSLKSKKIYIETIVASEINKNQKNIDKILNLLLDLFLAFLLQYQNHKYLF